MVSIRAGNVLRQVCCGIRSAQEVQGLEKLKETEVQQIYLKEQEEQQEKQEVCEVQKYGQLMSR